MQANEPSLSQKPIQLPFTYEDVAKEAVRCSDTCRYVKVLYSLPDKQLFCITSDLERGTMAPKQLKGTIRLFMWDRMEENKLQDTDLIIESPQADSDYKDYLNFLKHTNVHPSFKDYLMYIVDRYQEHLIVYLMRRMQEQKLIRMWRRNYRRHLRALQKEGLSS
jgi:hypothetical protein